MKRAVPLFLAVLLSTACQTTPGDPTGSGGALASGGAASGGAPAGGYNNPDGTLHTLECERGGPITQWVVRGTTCSLFPDHIEMYVGYEGESRYTLIGVVVEGLQPGLRLTEYGGVANFVGLGVCGGPTSEAAPDPCEVELITLERGEVAAGGAGGTTTEFGSGVRVRISCPNGLYLPGADDVGPSLTEFVPTEFELEASDCLLMED